MRQKRAYGAKLAGAGAASVFSGICRRAAVSNLIKCQARLIKVVSGGDGGLRRPLLWSSATRRSSRGLITLALHPTCHR